MSTGSILDREEYIEQAYFFRVLRERLATNLPTQEVLARLDEEILSTTRLPYAIQFLSTELKHSGLLSSGFARLLHYFTTFQAFVIRQTEEGGQRLSFDMALLVLEREAVYRARDPTAAGLFVYYADLMRRQIGVVEFADLLYLRSDLYVADQRRVDPGYQPPVAALFGEKEGKIARASRGRDPLYLFAALQRQLGYPDVPRPKPRDDTGAKLETLQAKMRELEMRLKLTESELRGQVDLTQFLGRPDLLSGPPEEES
jgi:hypothetical protein